MSETVTLTFPAKPDYLVLSRLALSGLARAYPVDEEVLADLKLAITEACGNAVRHAYEAEDGPITVAFSVAGDRIEIVVEDHGTGLSVAPDEEWAMPDEPSGGMGMAIIRTVVDELDVTTGADGRGTVVRMAKHLAAPPADTDAS